MSLPTPQQVNLTQLKKCDQRWEDMSPTEQGRLCQKCQNVIVDFRKSTHREVMETHAFSPEKVCGIYRKDQLILPKKPEYTSRSTRWKSFYLGLIGFLFAENVHGQGAKTPVPVEQTEKTAKPFKQTHIAPSEQRAAPSQESIILSGIMRDETGEPIIGGIVTVASLGIGALSDIDGHYRLDLTEAFEASPQLTATFKYVGYDTQEIILKKSAGTQVLHIEFQESDSQISVFYITQPYESGISLWDDVKRLFRRR